MPNTTTKVNQPVTEEALFAEKAKFWGSFTSGSTMAAGAVIVLLVLMWIFLA